MSAAEPWEVPEGWKLIDPRIGQCRSCGAPVMWLQNLKTAKKAPFDPDSKSHFATCPQAASWRQRDQVSSP